MCSDIIKLMQEKPFRPTDVRLRQPNANMGFTLAELLVTISIAAILAALAVPSFSSSIATHRAKSTSMDLYVDLIRTRSEALKFNKSVSLSSKAGGWTNGWNILDPGTGNVMEDHGPLKGVTVTTFSGPSTIVYNSYGRVKGGATSLAIATTGPNVVSRCVTVDTGGRPYIKGSAC